MLLTESFLQFQFSDTFLTPTPRGGKISELAGLSFKNGFKILLFLFTRSEKTRNCSNNQAPNSLHWHLLSTCTTQHRPSECEVLHASANWVCSSAVSTAHRCWQQERAGAFTTSLSPSQMPQTPQRAPVCSTSCSHIMGMACRHLKKAEDISFFTMSVVNEAVFSHEHGHPCPCYEDKAAP